MLLLPNDFNYNTNDYHILRVNWTNNIDQDYLEKLDKDYISKEEMAIVEIITDINKFYIVLYNIHNGYYSHDIFLEYMIDDEILFDKQEL